MNNKKVFSFNMFWETFKQLKAIGIIGTLLIMVAGIYPNIMSSLELEMYADVMGDNTISIQLFEKTIVNVIQHYEFLCLIFMVFTPLLSLGAWKFLNKRSTSDFYHSLSYTRVSLFFSRLTAVLIWSLIIVVVSFVSNVIVYNVFADYFQVDYLVLFRIHLAAFVCSVLVAGAFSLGCSITGNMFNNLIVSGLIIFLPRVITMIVSSTIADMVRIVSESNAVSFISNEQNMVVSWGVGIFERIVSMPDLILSIEANVYTFVLALIYIGVGLVFFNKRKSEGAGKSLCHKGAAYVIKVVIAASVAIAGFSSVLSGAYYESYNSSVQWESYISSIVTALVVSMAVIFIYEYISVKKECKIKDCLTSSVLGWVVAGVIVLLTYAGAEAALSYTPDKSKVDYVTITSRDVVTAGSDLEYIETLTGRVKYTDEKVIEMVCNSLKENVDSYKNGQYSKYYYYDNDSSSRIEGREPEPKGYVEYYVYFNDGLFGNHRIVYVSVEEQEKLISCMQQVPEYKEAFYSLPEYDDIWLYFHGCNGLSDEKKKQIYDCFLAEQREVDFVDYYNDLNDLPSSGFSVSIHSEFSQDGYMYCFYRMISQDVFPKTVNMYLNMCNEYYFANEKNVEKTKNIIKIAAEKEDYTKDNNYVSAAIYLPGGEDTIGIGMTRRVTVNSKVIEDGEEIIDTFYPLIAQQLRKADNIDFTDMSKTYVKVTIDYRREDDTYESGTYYIVLDNVDIDLSKYISE